MDTTNFDGRRATNVPLVVEARGGRSDVFMGVPTPSDRAATVEGTTG